MSKAANKTTVLVRGAVKSLLTSSPAFGQLPPDKKSAIAEDMVRVGTYLVAPDGISGNKLGGTVVVTPPNGLVNAVDFPGFVSRLIKGVFNAAVDASIKQMEAYGNLVKNVAQTVDAFTQDVVSDDHGRGYLVTTFPDYFEFDTDKCIRIRAGIDKRQALRRLKHLVADGRLTKLDQAAVEKQLVPAARRRLAANRQQLLASMVLMGINRASGTDSA